MNVAVIGGSGFVGRHVVRDLASRGARVWTVDLNEPARPVHGEEFLRLDLQSGSDSVARVAQRCAPLDGVVHLAAMIRRTFFVDESAAQDVAVMAHGPLRFLAALPRPPAALVYLSSIQVYGRPRTLPVREDHPAHPTALYGIAKLYAEHVLRIACDRAGTSACSLRAAFIYGPGQHERNVIPRFIAIVRRGEAPTLHGSGRDIRDDVYVGDVARAASLAIERRARGTFNVASGQPHTLLDVAETICRVAGGGLVPRHEPIGSPWVDAWYSIERIQNELGFSPEVSLEQGIRAMFDEEAP